MSMIVTRAQAAAHLRIDDATDEAADLDLKIEAASGVVLDYLEMDISDFGDSDSDGPPEIAEQIQIATLLLVGELHRNRDGGSGNYSEANLPAPIRAILYPLKTWGLS